MGFFVLKDSLSELRLYVFQLYSDWLLSKHIFPTAMQNPEGLQASETDIINHLQNYNKHYLNNEMAAETGN